VVFVAVIEAEDCILEFFKLTWAFLSLILFKPAVVLVDVKLFEILKGFFLAVTLLVTLGFGKDFVRPCGGGWLFALSRVVRWNLERC